MRAIFFLSNITNSKNQYSHWWVGSYINLNSNSNQCKPHYGLIKDARGTSQESAKDVILTRSIKFTPKVSLRKQRSSLSQVVWTVLWNSVSPVSQGNVRCFQSQAHSSVTPGRCYWNGIFPAQTGQGWDNKCPLWSLKLVTNSPATWPSWTKWCCLWLYVSEP